MELYQHAVVVRCERRRVHDNRRVADGKGPFGDLKRLYDVFALVALLAVVPEPDVIDPHVVVDQEAFLNFGYA